MLSDETNSFAAAGPVISVSASSGGVRNVTPSPSPAYVTAPSRPGGSGARP